MNEFRPSAFQFERIVARDRFMFRAQMIPSKTRVDVRYRGAAAMLLGARRRDAVIARHNCTAPFVSSITRLDWRSACVGEENEMSRREGKKKVERYMAGRN